LPNEVTTILSKGGTVVNVKDYGAVGDGSTPDDAAFAAAVAAAHAADDVLIIPDGVYAISSLPNMAKDNFSVLGIGSRPTIKHTGSPRLPTRPFGAGSTLPN
jgi:hypothetical protein